MIKRFSENVRLGWRLLPYGLQAKTNMVVLLIFLVVALLQEILLQGRGFFGLYFMAIIPLYLSQLWNSVAISNLMQGSAKKKQVLIEVPTVYSLLSTICLYALLVLLRLLYYRNGALTRTAMLGLLYFGAILFMLVLYNVLVFRKPVLGYVMLVVMIFFISFTGGFTFGTVDDTAAAWHSVSRVLELPLFDHPVRVGVLGLLLVIFDTVLFYVLSLALYKLPISERVYKQAMARAARR